MKNYLEFIKESILSYRFQMDVMAQKNVTGAPREFTVKFTGNSYDEGLEETVEYSKKVLDGNTTIENLVIYKINELSGITNYNTMVKWWGNCGYKDAALSQVPEYFTSYLFGLEGAYKDIILKAPNIYQLIDKIKKTNPKLYDKLLLIDPKLDAGADMGNMGF